MVNCRARPQVKLSGDLAAEREALPDRVVHAPMRDLGQRQRPRLWAEAAAFAARALAEDPQARVLIHCHRGRRRSAMLAYAVLRLRGHDVESAAALVLRVPAAGRARAQLRAERGELAGRPRAPRIPGGACLRGRSRNVPDIISNVHDITSCVECGMTVSRTASWEMRAQ